MLTCFFLYSFPLSSSSLFCLLSASLSLSLIEVYYFHCIIFNKERHKDALKTIDMVWLIVDSAVLGTKRCFALPLRSKFSISLTLSFLNCRMKHLG